MKYFDDDKPGYKRIALGMDGAKFSKVGTPITVIVSVEKKDDNKNWLHLSFAHPSRILRHEEQFEIKERFIGEDEYAIAVMPPRSKHVNIHPNCLHLWHCLDGHPLPEFSGFLNGYRSI